MLKNAIMLDPKNEDAFIDLGDIYMGTDDIDSAIKAYCEAVRLNPDKASAFNKCGLALCQKDYLEEAIIAYNKAISADSEFPDAYNNLGMIYLEGIRNLSEAERLFKTAIRLKKDYAAAYYNLGRVYKEKREITEAAKYFQEALELNETQPELDSDDIRKNLYSLFEV